MTVLPIWVFPDPLLKSVTRPVERITPAVQQLIEGLIETMRHHPRCVGLAAPQIGSNVRVAVFDVSRHPKAKRSSGLVVLVNPQIIAHEGTTIQREGCLSIPDFTANVRRAVRLQLQAWNASGRQFIRWFDAFEAIVAQHEIDHLDGNLFLDRVANLKTDVFRRKTYL